MSSTRRCTETSRRSSRAHCRRSAIGGMRRRRIWPAISGGSSPGIQSPRPPTRDGTSSERRCSDIAGRWRPARRAWCVARGRGGLRDRSARARRPRRRGAARQSSRRATSNAAGCSGLTGSFMSAETLVWRELFRNPDSRHAWWTLWEIYSRQPSLWARDAHEGGTASVRFSPDGRWILTSGQDGFIRVLLGRRRSDHPRARRT